MIPGQSQQFFEAAAAQAGAAGYEITRSLRFNSADSAYLNRTPSAAGNRNTWTLSWWMKRSKLSNNFQTIFGVCDATATYYTQLRFGSNDKLSYQEKGSANGAVFETEMVFRDTASWYHCVFVFNNTASSDSEKARLYVNGSEITTFSTDNRSLIGSTATAWNNNVQHNISHMRPYSGSFDFDGYLADVHFIDGQALAPTDFGQYDANNVWQPKAYSGTYGTNGFHLDFSDNSSAAALGTDSSGNSNTWTVNNLSVAGGPLSSSRGTNYDDDSATYTEYGTVSQATGQTLPMSNPSHYEGAAMRVNTGGFKVVTTNSATTDFFMACWVKFDSLANGYQMGVDLQGNYKYFEARSGGDVLVRHTGGAASQSSSNVITTNTWKHIALSRSGGTLRAFVDGTIVCSTTDGVTGDSISANEEFNFFGQSGTLYNIPGYLLDPVVYIGAGRSTNFTAPTAPLLTSAGAINDVAGMSSSNRYYASPLISVGAGEEAIDSLIDTPTNYEADSGNNGGNYCTLNPLDKSADYTLQNGNLDFVTNGINSWEMVRATFAVSSGKWYWEFTAGDNETAVGIAKANASLISYIGADANGWSYFYSGDTYNNSINTAYGASFTTNDVIGVAFDADAGSLYFYKNGTVQNSGTAAFTGLTSGPYFPGFSIRDSGSTSVVNFGQRPFAYTPPTGYVSLCTQNLPDPTIADGSTAMDVVLYTGDGNSTQTITGLNFAPDLTWQKIRNTAGAHGLTDSARGVSAGYLRSDSTAAETGSSANGVSAFTSDGFTAAGAFNTSSNNWVTWAWDAGTSTVSNTDGSITSSVRANQSAGFSIVTYTGNATGGATVGHGLGVSPALILLKSRGGARNWVVYSSSLTSAAYYLSLNQTIAQTAESTVWNSTAPTSTVFSIGTDLAVNNSSENYVAYCFAPVDGYSSFGSYTGNGSTDGPFVYAGHRSRFIMIKRTNGLAPWVMVDTERNTFNVMDNHLLANDSAAENGSTIGNICDSVSNGFKLRGSDGWFNGSSATYAYVSFASHPFKTARAR